MKYISTRGLACALSFEDVMLSGLARDGGLYVPKTYPTFLIEEIAGFKNQTYEDIAFSVMKPFMGDIFTDQEFRDIIKDAYATFTHKERCPVKKIENNHYLLELFHGPTLAFKDVAMQLIGRMFDSVLKRRGEKMTIIGATSGDTGSAAIEAFRGLDMVDVFIMYPHGRVSDVQRRQMTTVMDKNIHVLAVDGNFDTCQSILKDMFNDFEFRDHVKLAGVNSINWARILAQVVYYFTSAVSVGAPDCKVSFSVPTGNFGDIFAGYVAKRMGLPIDRLLIATNQNDILYRTMQTGVHEKTGLRPSISPSMDIEVSSNFERLVFELYDRDAPRVAQLFQNLKETGAFTLSPEALANMNKLFKSGRVSEDETKESILEYYKTIDEVLCPHSAIAAKVSKDLRDPQVPMISLATAHPAKFPVAVSHACGVSPALPEHMADLFERNERFYPVSGELEAVQQIIKSRVLNG